MSGGRTSLDYPEHLNPFREEERSHFWKIGRLRRNSIGDAFKDFRNTLTLKSLRGKKKKETHETSPVVLRKNPEPPIRPNRRTTPATATPILLPRSRISERATISNPIPADQFNQNHHEPLPNSTPTPKRNPFGDEDTITRRRKKKRAPLPPGMGSSYPNISSSHNNSKWSLASADTDISVCSNQSQISDDDPVIATSDISQVFTNFTKEMEKMTDDSNNNLIVNETTENETEERVENNSKEDQIEDEIDENKTVSVAERVNAFESKISTISTEDEKKIDQGTERKVPKITIVHIESLEDFKENADIICCDKDASNQNGSEKDIGTSESDSDVCNNNACNDIEINKPKIESN